MGHITRRWLCRLSAVALGAGLAGVACAAEGSAQAATWQSKELKFTYMGFTTHYSCDGLAAKVKDILLQLGARADLQVHEYGCTSTFGRPDPFPGVRAKFSVLVPLKDTEAAKTAADQIVSARWHAVQLRLDRDRASAAGECELIEQAKHQILPLFSTRNVNFSSDCVPHQLTLKGADLSVEVMEPVPRKAQGQPGAEKNS